MLIYFLIIPSLVEKPGNRSFLYNTKLSRIFQDTHERYQIAIHVCSFLASKTEKKTHQSYSLQVIPAVNTTYFFFAIKVKKSYTSRCEILCKVLKDIWHLLKTCHKMEKKYVGSSFLGDSCTNHPVYTKTTSGNHLFIFTLEGSVLQWIRTKSQARPNSMDADLLGGQAPFECAHYSYWESSMLCRTLQMSFKWPLK